MISRISNYLLEGQHGRPIPVDAVFENDEKQKPVVIFSHGFKGFKNWGHFDRTAEWFAAEGFVFVKFNFSHNGHSIVDPIECDDVEAFGQNNFSIELDDLGCVIDWVLSSSKFANNIDLNDVSLIGHSRGGGISILKTAEDDRISKLVTWASVADFGNRFTAEQIQFWKETGKLDIVNGRTGQVLPMYFQLYENYHANLSRLSVPENAKGLKVPTLVVHGTQDEAVPHAEAVSLTNWIKDSQLLTLQNSGHTFEGKHPFAPEEAYPENLKTVITETITFLKA